MPPPGDEQLIERIQQGEIRRFADLVDRHKDRALTVAVRLLRRREDAEEAVQDAFVRAFRGLAEFRGESRFSTWFYRILYNICLTRLRRAQVGQVGQVGMTVSIDDPDVADPAAAVVDEGDDPLDQLDVNETRAIIAEEMARLQERFRLPVTLFYVNEMSYEEIAAVLDAPIGTVKTNLFRGRVALRDQVRARFAEGVHA
jgi:RNA polymerase sigma-70 factor (ECF subfamily)